MKVGKFKVLDLVLGFTIGVILTAFLFAKAVPNYSAGPAAISEYPNSQGLVHRLEDGGIRFSTEISFTICDQPYAIFIPSGRSIDYYHGITMYERAVTLDQNRIATIELANSYANIMCPGDTEG